MLEWSTLWISLFKLFELCPEVDISFICGIWFTELELLLFWRPILDKPMLIEFIIELAKCSSISAEPTLCCASDLSVEMFGFPSEALKPFNRWLFCCCCCSSICCCCCADKGICAPLFAADSCLDPRIWWFGISGAAVAPKALDPEMVVFQGLLTEAVEVTDEEAEAAAAL